MSHIKYLFDQFSENLVLSRLEALIITGAVASK